MSVIWSATQPGSRRFSPVPARTGPAELESHFRRLRSRRIRGYIEVEIADSEAPLLAIGFRGEYAVIHKIVRAPVRQSFLLAGDGSVPREAYVNVPIMDELSRFTGDVVLEVHPAWEAVRTFLRTGQAADLGEWHAR
ncbi:hypothetical protein OHA21_17115 [Actinoplanes sp. NBC_00393]|uniref:hypothetical protein n=1 Tax=Actinoplanes sp. NBC_00393 TaxID=2975953 RepID=UPI002E1F8882